ncbi:MAG: DUF11 domain-containing protein, partial [Thermoplasmata archaeon]
MKVGGKKAWVIFLTLLLSLSVIVPINRVASVPIGNHEIVFISHTYDEIRNVSRWTYLVKSGSHPSISHWVMELGGCIDEDDIVNASEYYEYMSTSHPDPTTGLAGIKFDTGYEDNEQRIVWFELKGDYPEGDAEVAIKAGCRVDYGYVTGPVCPCYIKGMVWHDEFHDMNHQVDGIKDDNEEGIEGVVLELYDVSGNLLHTATTDENGNYSFAVSSYGWYRVKIADSNFDGLLKNWYSSDGNDDHQTWVYIGCGECEKHVDFGFFHTCISLQKTGPTHAVPGQQITYHFVVENCGDVVLHGGAHVYDELLNPCGNHEIWEHVVWPGEVYEFDYNYTIPCDFCGLLINNATAVGHPCLCNHYYPDVYDNSSWTTNVTCSPCTQCLVIDATHWGWVEKNDPCDNHYDDDKIHVRAKPGCCCCKNARRAYYYFDISNLPEGKIVDAKFIVDPEGNKGAGLLGLYNTSWDGMPPLTWNNAPPMKELIDTTYYDESTTPLIFNVTSLFSSNPDNISLMMRFQDDENPAHDEHCDHTHPRLLLTINKCADLSITKIDEPDPVIVGDMLEYTLVVTNNGINDAKNVIITDSLPNEIQNPQYSADGGATWHAWNGSFYIHFLPSHAVQQILIRGIVSINAPDKINNTAEVNSTTLDTNPANNRDWEETTILHPGINVTKEAVPSVIHSGDNVTYYVNITNNGDCNLYNVKIKDSNNLSFSYNGGDDGDGILESGEAWSYMARTTIYISTQNRVNVSAETIAGSRVYGEDSAYVTVIHPSISIEKKAYPSVIHSGDNVTWNITIKNTGDCELYNITINDSNGYTTTISSLSPNETWWHEYITNPFDDFTNVANVSAKDEIGMQVHDEDTASIHVI